MVKFDETEILNMDCYGNQQLALDNSISHLSVV